MKAFIFNSGVGSRMEHLTKDNPKALVKLSNGDTILGRQIRILKNHGINQFVITTGPFENQIEDFVKNIKNIDVKFINNEVYDSTNSIYSLFISRHLFDDDFIILHGDLVFNSNLIYEILHRDEKDLALIGKTMPIPEKDFKGLVLDEKLRLISVDIDDENAYALQPLYKLKLETIKLWLIEVSKMIEEQKVNVYAENALNRILKDLDVAVLDYSKQYIDEVDNLSDLDRVSRNIFKYDYKDQKIKVDLEYAEIIKDYILTNQLNRPLLVHGKHLLNDSTFVNFIKQFNFPTFNSYSPNPLYEEVLDGLEIFKSENCDSIIAIGGGSCIDVAKAIKLYSHHKLTKDVIYLDSNYVDLKLIAVPTTAGTGTESTRYSVIYYKKEKQSLVNDSLLPDLVILNPLFLSDLPIYQRKATLLDALCQSIESYWSINSTVESKQYSEKAINLILKQYKAYIQGKNDNLELIMRASNLAGKAINITQTTAPHAMSYKITSLTNISHGHAVALCLPEVYSFMINNMDLNIDQRGFEYLKQTFDELSDIFDAKDYKDLSIVLKQLFSEFHLDTPIIDDKDLNVLIQSVNLTRLKNNPIKLSKENIGTIYQKVFSFK